MFDFWFEYKHVVPKGFVRFLGKLAELTDAGIEVHFFTGNHDLWTFGYLEQEIGLKVHKEPELIDINGKKFFVAHGDGFQKDGLKSHIIRYVFHNRFFQKMFVFVPSCIGVPLGFNWSKNNRLKDNRRDYSYQGEDKESLVIFAKKQIETHDEIDYFVFGHRHILLDLQLKNQSRVLIIGDWFTEFSYAVFDGEEEMCLHSLPDF